MGPGGDPRPLDGITVVVTRAVAQASELDERLALLGATSLDVPVIAIEDPADGGAALHSTLATLRPDEWLVVTSPNGASRVAAVFERMGPTRGVRIAAIGPGTAAALASRGYPPDLVPVRAVAEELSAALGPPPGVGPRRVVIARAEVGRDVLPSELAAAGWEVEVVAAYRTVAALPAPGAARALDGADLITFLSSSAVERFVEIHGLPALPPVVVSIGPLTTATARRFGIAVDVEADPHTVDGLVAAVVGWARHR